MQGARQHKNHIEQDKCSMLEERGRRWVQVAEHWEQRQMLGCDCLKKEALLDKLPNEKSGDLSGLEQLPAALPN